MSYTQQELSFHFNFKFYLRNKVALRATVFLYCFCLCCLYMTVCVCVVQTKYCRSDTGLRIIGIRYASHLFPFKSSKLIYNSSKGKWRKGKKLYVLEKISKPFESKFRKRGKLQDDIKQRRLSLIFSMSFFCFFFLLYWVILFEQNVIYKLQTFYVLLVVWCDMFYLLILLMENYNLFQMIYSNLSCVHKPD